MFLKFLQLEIKSLFRSPQLATSLVAKIGMFFMMFYMTIALVGGAFGLYAYADKKGINAVQLFTRIFLIYWLIDLVLKYFIQQLPTNNIKPFLTMNISKNTITRYTLGKILSSFFSWAFLLFIIPFTGLLLFDGSYAPVSVIGLAFSCIFLLFTNTFINTLINKNDTLSYIVFGAIFLLAGLHYFNIINVMDVSQALFFPLYEHAWLFIIPLVLLLGVGYFTFNFVKNNLYLDKGLEVKTKVGKSENIQFLNRYGVIGTFINNDVKLIKRSKAARGALIGGVLFLFYGLLFFSGGGYETSAMQIFLGIFVTGGMNMIFGQRVPAWDSSYYPLMMTLNVPYKDYLRAKWSLSVMVIALSMVLAVFYAFVVSWEFYLTIIAGGFYNLGVNSYLTLLAGAFNKKPIDLNSATKGFAGGQNNFNIKAIVLIIPQLVVPMLVYGLVNYFLGLIPAVVCIGILGLIGFFLRDKIFDRIVKIYKTEKYSTIAAFKKKD